MNLVVAIVLRFAVIVLGYACACIAASGFLNFVTLGSLGFDLDEAGGVATGSMLFTVPVVALLIAYFCFFPSMLVIVVAEVLGKRDWLFHALGGALVALVFLSIIAMVDDEKDLMGDARFSLLMVGGGLVGGLAYWLIAGRGSGTWREAGRLQPLTPPDPPGS